MSAFRQFGRGLHALTHRAGADHDVDDEVQHYLDQLTRELVRNGMSPADARRAATLQIGTSIAVRERVRASGWEHGLEMTVSDVHYALRRLRHQPAFTIVATLTLALSIGATTAIFSAVNPILLRPLPYPGADRIVAIDDRGADGTPFPSTFGTYEELSARSHSFEALAAVDDWTPSLIGTEVPERLQGERVSATFFRVIGVEPTIGRSFDATEDQVGGPQVVVLSYRIVKRHFAGDSAIIGSTIRLDGDIYRVVGVMPRDFVDVLRPTADIWSPLQAHTHTGFNSREWGHHYRIVGRLAPRLTGDAAAAELSSIGKMPVASFPRPRWANMTNGLEMRSLQDQIVAGARPALLAIVGAVLLLLTIACVNVTNLLVARGTRRRGEFAMRAALGAGPRRLMRQLVTESLVLAAIGGAIGVVVAALGVRALVALSPPGLPRIEAVRIDGWVLAFAVVLTTVVGLLVGLLPAVSATRASLNDGLQGLTRRLTGGRAAMRQMLVIAEVSLAIVLLISAGLLVRSLEHLFGVAPGFEPAHLLTMQVVEAGSAYHPDSARQRFYEQSLNAVRAVPGVVDAAFTSQLPLSGDADGYGYELAAFPDEKPGENGSAYRYAVNGDYFRTMRIPLRAGRLLDASDRAGTPEAIVVSESFARHKFGSPGAAIGQRARFGPEVGSTRPWGTIVGVVGDVKQEALGASEMDAFYIPAPQWWWVDNVASLVVRAGGDASSLSPSIRRAIWSVDRNQPITRVATMDALIARSASQRRFASVVFEAFALTALILAAMGLYGVISSGVAERTREIGIRVALGATSGEIVARIVGGALLLTFVGVLLGIGGGFLASRMLESLLFGITRADPLTYAGVVSLLTVVAAVSCWSPARRAASVDPAITLRSE